jgi:hypothetical protein
MLSSVLTGFLVGAGITVVVAAGIIMFATSVVGEVLDRLIHGS